ncbi:aminomethyltransferase beta-barrel domain-containing protein [Candidatus Vidania fulgoroideorum]
MNIKLAFSGGIDSTTSLFILTKLLYSINCFFFENNIKNEFNNCSSKKEIIKCFKILKKINSKIKILNISKNFKKKIFKKIIKEYKKGKTINPDIICNKKIKFRYLKKKNCAFGHYAKKKKNKLKISSDKNKDQTYFIYKIIKNIKNFFFPLSNWKKKEVKYLINFLNLKCNKKSKGICFIYNNNFFSFIKKFIKSKGIIFYKKKKICNYKNLYFQTIGQRLKKNINKKCYIYKKKYGNIFVVKNNKNTLLYKRKFEIKNFIIKKTINKIYHAKYNSRSKLKKIFILKKKKKLIINFIYPIKNINIGQSIVIYEKKYCIGGGEVI